MRTLTVVAVLAISFAALAAGKFTLKSTELKPDAALPQKQVFNGMGCTGQNLSPQLSWENAPKDTKSFVVTVYDPDAPTGSGWWHWVVYDIPANVKELPEGAGSGQVSLPEGAKQARSDYGQPGYGGACPPPGSKPHRYLFTVYALKVEKLDVPAEASPAMIGFATHANELAKATLTARYSRK